MGTSFWTATDDRSSVIAGDMHVMPVMPGVVMSMMNAMASAMVALEMVMLSFCGGY